MRLNHLGVTLRDSHGVVQMRFHGANKILRIVKSVVGFDLDLLRKRLERKDEGKNSMLILVEPRIHRLARYYKPKGILSANWKYDLQIPRR